MSFTEQIHTPEPLSVDERIDNRLERIIRGLRDDLGRLGEEVQGLSDDLSNRFGIAREMPRVRDPEESRSDLARLFLQFLEDIGINLPDDFGSAEWFEDEGRVPQEIIREEKNTLRLLEKHAQRTDNRYLKTDYAVNATDMLTGKKLDLIKQCLGEVKAEETKLRGVFREAKTKRLRRYCQRRVRQLIIYKQELDKMAEHHGGGSDTPDYEEVPDYIDDGYLNAEAYPGYGYMPYSMPSPSPSPQQPEPQEQPPPRTPISPERRERMMANAARQTEYRREALAKHSPTGSNPNPILHQMALQRFNTQLEHERQLLGQFYTQSENYDFPMDHDYLGTRLNALDEQQKEFYTDSQKADKEIDEWRDAGLYT